VQRNSAAPSRDLPSPSKPRRCRKKAGEWRASLPVSSNRRFRERFFCHASVFCAAGRQARYLRGRMRSSPVASSARVDSSSQA
jgi:hypothetical protein